MESPSRKETALRVWTAGPRQLWESENLPRKKKRSSFPAKSPTLLDRVAAASADPWVQTAELYFFITPQMHVVNPGKSSQHEAVLCRANGESTCWHRWKDSDRTRENHKSEFTTENFPNTYHSLEIIQRPLEFGPVLGLRSGFRSGRNFGQILYGFIYVHKRVNLILSLIPSAAG